MKNYAGIATGPLALALISLACSSEPGTQPDNHGGQPNSGSGGAQPGQGGTSPSNGGSPANGGSNNPNGGSTNGGTQSTNGGSSAGGSNGGNGSGGSNAGGSTSGGSNNGGSSAGGKANSGGTNAGGSTSGGSNAGGKTSGGTSAGGSTAKGGSGGTGTGGSGTGGSGTGGNTAKGGSGSGGAGTGGSGTGGSGTGGSTGGQIFSQCRFHFGTIDTKAKAGGSAMISQLDFFTPGWMTGKAFDHGFVCDETKSGAALQNQVPVVVGYVAAAYVKNTYNLCDCNASGCGTNMDLCHMGAQYISQNLTAIVNVYKAYSAGYAACYGTTRPIIFEMEPDWYQYTDATQTQRWTRAQAGQIMSQLVAALKTSLPNARFSMDASPWVAKNDGTGNGSDNGAEWYANFNMSLFTFVNTSGGGTSAGTAKIRSANNMTWAGLSQVTGKPVLADTGYGVNGSSAGHDAAWDSAANINARMADGVVSIAQYNPNSNWGSTISSVRSQLNTPKFCP